MLRLVEIQDSWERREKEKCLKEVKWMQVGFVSAIEIKKMYSLNWKIEYCK